MSLCVSWSAGCWNGYRPEAIMYTFWCLGRCCEATNQKTHAGISFALRGNNIFGAIMEAPHVARGDSGSTSPFTGLARW
jgi:hypothetical protein